MAKSKSKSSKKPTAKKTAAPKAVKAKKTVRAAAAQPTQTIFDKPITKAQTKTQIIKSIAEDTGLSTREITEVFSSLGRLIECHLKKRGSGKVALPKIGVVLKRAEKKASKAREGRNPFTGEKITIPAKPKRTVVRVTALKSLKELVNQG